MVDKVSYCNECRNNAECDSGCWKGAALILAERWENVHTDESYGASGKNLGTLARAFLKMRAEKVPSERGLTDEATKLAEQWKGRADDAGRLSRAVLTQPDILAQVERALRKNPLIAMFLDQGFWHAHHVDIVIRHDGQDRRYEADWIVDLWYIVRRRGLSVADAVRADQVGEGVSGGQSDPR